MSPVTAGQEIRRRIIRAAERELRAIAEDLHDRAVNDISVSPADDDDDKKPLRESGVVSEVTFDGSRMTVKVGFHAIHAAAQHEGAWSYYRDGKHVVQVVKKHPGGGRTKYLEANLKEMVPEYQERLAAAIRRELRS